MIKPDQTRRPILTIVPSRAKAAHTITITDEAFGCGFDVCVVPPPAGVGHDRDFGALPDAEVYASRLASATGWPIVFLTGADRSRDTAA